MSPAITTVEHGGGVVRGEDGSGQPTEIHIPDSTRYRQTPLEPGQGFEMSDGRVYIAGPDGCLRRAGRVREKKKQRRARRREAGRFVKAAEVMEEFVAGLPLEDVRRAQEGYEYVRARGLRP